MENKQTPKTIATRTMAKADGMAGEHSLTYGTNANGKHVIRVGYPAGEDICPDYYRYDSIEEARATWKRFVANWIAKGYIDADQYWAALKAKVGVS